MSELPSLLPCVFIADLHFHEVHLTGINGEDFLVDADHAREQTHRTQHGINKRKSRG